NSQAAVQEATIPMIGILESRSTDRQASAATPVRALRLNIRGALRRKRLSSRQKGLRCATPCPMRRRALLLSVLFGCASTGPRPPLAKKEAHIETWHGQRRADDYFWLRQKGTPEVEDYLRAENAYTDSAMKPTEALQNKLYSEMLARIKQTDLSVPYQKRGY